MVSYTGKTRLEEHKKVESTAVHFLESEITSQMRMRIASYTEIDGGKEHIPK